jgi:hypothetical protein
VIGVTGVVSWKFAVTARATVIARVHAPVPEQSPLHPVNVESPSAVAVSVTESVVRKPSSQSLPQLMPVPLTVPVPRPVLRTSSGGSSSCAKITRAANEKAAQSVSAETSRTRDIAIFMDAPAFPRG